MKEDGASPDLHRMTMPPVFLLSLKKVPVLPGIRLLSPLRELYPYQKEQFIKAVLLFPPMERCICHDGNSVNALPLFPLKDFAGKMLP